MGKYYPKTTDWNLAINWFNDLPVTHHFNGPKRKHPLTLMLMLNPCSTVCSAGVTQSRSSRFISHKYTCNFTRVFIFNKLSIFTGNDLICIQSPITDFKCTKNLNAEPWKHLKSSLNCSLHPKRITSDVGHKKMLKKKTHTYTHP